jgi:large subunit ribosomal protein L6e
MPGDKKPAAKPKAKTPVKAPAAGAAGKAKTGPSKPKVAYPKNAMKLMMHSTTRPLWSKLRKTAKRKGVAPETLLKKKAKFVVKPIGGEKNGGKRLVRVQKEKKYYPTENQPKKHRTGHVTHKMHKRSFKAGLEPGRVVIVLSGKHKGKRVVVLKTLPSGLLLVTGPHIINGCPLRRMHQMFTIVTSTKLDISSVKVGDEVNDKYFKRKRDDNKKNKSKRGEGGDIFDTKTEAYKPDENRKKTQIAVDTQILDVIRKHKEKKLLFSYLGSFFQLRNRMYPHKMKF